MDDMDTATVGLVLELLAQVVIGKATVLHANIGDPERDGRMVQVTILHRAKPKGE